MTREEAKDLFRLDRDSYGKVRKLMTKIDEIFDDFEKEKSCDGCKYKPNEGENYPMRCGECKRFYYDMFEGRK